MPKPTKGVPVELDKTRHLRFPLSALHAIAENPSLEHVLYLGLKHEDDTLTPESVGDLVGLDMLDSLQEPLKKATGGLVDLSAVFGGEEDGGKKKPMKKAGS
jgi:hypothetical protein